MNNGTQNYVLTKKQLYILLVGCGGESVRGLKIDGDVPDKAEIIKTIGELSDRGYVVSDGNSFHTVGDIDKIIKLIMFAPDFYIIKGRNNVPDLCCYGDKKQFAVCEVMVTKADSINFLTKGILKIALMNILSVMMNLGSLKLVILKKGIYPVKTTAVQGECFRLTK